MAGDHEAELAARVREAAGVRQTLRLRGGDTKGFYGRAVDGTELDLRDHAGVVSYEPTELVLTARAGTPLTELEALLAAHGQTLPFEPPHFGPGATLGGAVASGLAGPRRPWGGAPRDLVLGVKILDGNAHSLRFGGQVMKNVAGYDLSRLMAGALGTLGILLEISVKVLPGPDRECTRVLQLGRDAALARMRELANRPAPLTGACHLDGRLYLRLSGNATGVAAWTGQVGGEDADNAIWTDLRDQRLPFFEPAKLGNRALWRLSLPPATARLTCEHHSVLDWAGAQRWVYSDTDPAVLRAEVAGHGGHATLFRHGGTASEVFHPLDAVRARLHAGLKRTFDPHGIFNPGRMYPDW